MLDPQKVYEIVSEVVASVDKPVTVKMRTGWNQQTINCVEIARLCEKAGAQGYRDTRTYSSSDVLWKC